MRILLIAVLALSGLACQKEIHEVRAPSLLQPLAAATDSGGAVVPTR